MVLSSNQGQVLDVTYWPDDYTQLILERFPSCKISVLSACDISSSGFYIYMHLEQQQIGDCVKTKKVHDSKNLVESSHHVMIPGDM